MTAYYDYLRSRLQTSPVASPAQLEQVITAERNALWQQMIANPSYDERTRMSALAQFDEAATRILSEQNSVNGNGFGRNPGSGPGPNVGPAAGNHSEPGFGPMPSFGPSRSEVVEEDYADHAPSRFRTLLRDGLIFLVGCLVGFVVAYFLLGSSPTARTSSNGSSQGELGVTAITPSQKSFKFVRSQPSALDGQVIVEYASGTPSDSYACEVEATYRQVLEYVKFDKACRTISFKFRPLAELWENFNYVQGYMVFTTTIMSPSGGKWQGSASVYFSIDGAA
jgi:hypothetical protein